MRGWGGWLGCKHGRVAAINFSINVARGVRAECLSIIKSEHAAATVAIRSLFSLYVCPAAFLEPGAQAVG